MSHPVTPSPVGPVPADVDRPGLRTEEASPPRPSWWRRPAPVLGLLLAIVSLLFSLLQLVGGIHDLVGPGVVSSSQVASEIQSRVTTGLATCSEDLPAQVGASISCTVLDGADTTTVRATVTAVQGDDVRYDLESVG